MAPAATAPARSWASPSPPAEISPAPEPGLGSLPLPPGSFGIPHWAGEDALPYVEPVHQAAISYHLPPRLIWAVIKTESNFHRKAVSRAGARGLMQLMPRTARALGVRDAFDAHDNIQGGARYLRRLANRFDGNLELTLAAYNAGPGTVKRYGGVPPYRQTRAYIRKVLALYWSTGATASR